MGIETEYGLFIDTCAITELANAAREIVESWDGVACPRWDYSHEDPKRDMRGFRVKRLATDPRDDAIERAAPCPTTPSGPCDRILTNGARLYHDHGHPEYSTPECCTLRDIVAHDKAGERVVLRCAQLFAARKGALVKVFKNNTDYHGMSYGTHENYLLKRDVPFAEVMSALVPFLCTRIIFTGAGKVGCECNVAHHHSNVQYQLSQRADFFTEVASPDTQYQRPILNTRDEPHADERKYRRMHIIAGDANMSEYATALKVGTTALVLELIECGWRPDIELRNPVEAVRGISHDPSWQWLVDLTDGRSIRAVEVQRIYLDAAQRMLAGVDGDTDWVLTEWQLTLDELEAEPMKLANRLDWVAKKQLLNMFVESEGLSWDDDVLKSLDLEYHNVEPSAGLFYALQAKGWMKRIVTDEMINTAIEHPPSDTRAYIRGLCISQFASAVNRASWSYIELNENGHAYALDLSRLIGDAVIEIIEALQRHGRLTVRLLYELCKQGC